MHSVKTAVEESPEEGSVWPQYPTEHFGMGSLRFRHGYPTLRYKFGTPAKNTPGINRFDAYTLPNKPTLDMILPNMYKIPELDLYLYR